MSFGNPITRPSIPNPKKDFKSLDPIDIMARAILGEAENQSYTGKVAIAYIVKNRRSKNLKEFGYTNEKDILLEPNQFDGLKLAKAYAPNTSSQTWKDSLFISQDYFYNGLRYDNPVGKCLWFNSHKTYNNNIIVSGGKEYYTGWGSRSLVVEKVILGGHTFFRVEGY